MDTILGNQELIDLSQRVMDKSFHPSYQELVLIASTMPNRPKVPLNKEQLITIVKLLLTDKVQGTTTPHFQIETKVRGIQRYLQDLEENQGLVKHFSIANEKFQYGWKFNRAQLATHLIWAFDGKLTYLLEKDEANKPSFLPVIMSETIDRLDYKQISILREIKGHAKRDDQYTQEYIQALAENVNPYELFIDACRFLMITRKFDALLQMLKNIPN